MEEHKMEDLIIDYVGGNLTGRLKEHVEGAIEKNREWKLEYERVSHILEMMETSVEMKPEPSLRKSFDAMLTREMNEAEVIKTTDLKPVSNKWFLRIAASITLLITGTLIGILVMKNVQNEHEIASLKNEMELTKKLVISSLHDQSSASGRLKGISTLMVMEGSDDEIIMALINTMNTDDNTNVRLAAVAALARFSDDSYVRKALISALETQDDPVVTISLINLMVRLKEEGAVEPLKNLLHREEIHEAVKDEAHLGIFELT